MEEIEIKDIKSAKAKKPAKAKQANVEPSKPEMAAHEPEFFNHSYMDQSKVKLPYLYIGIVVVALLLAFWKLAITDENTIGQAQQERAAKSQAFIKEIKRKEQIPYQ